MKPGFRPRGGAYIALFVMYADRGRIHGKPRHVCATHEARVPSPRNAVVNQDAKEKFARAVDALNRADFPAAIEILSDILGDDSENAEAWRRLGLCYLETAQPDLALEALTRAVKADPGHATAHYLLGNAYGAMGQLEKAAACYRRALEAEPNTRRPKSF